MHRLISKENVCQVLAVDAAYNCYVILELTQIGIVLYVNTIIMVKTFSSPHVYNPELNLLSNLF